MSHTPGSWVFWPGQSEVHNFQPQRDEQGAITGDTPWRIAVIDHLAISDEVRIANGKLFAAAPDLLAACQKAMAWMQARGHDYSDFAAEYDTLQAAIAKAQ